MYQGKHHKRSRRTKKSAALLVSLLLLLTITVGGTIAFLIDSDGPLENRFNPSQVTTYVYEEFDGRTKSNVSIKNTGDTTAWIRATVVITWQDEDGNVYGQAPVAGTNYTDWDPGADWVKGNDDFYYYTKPVAHHEDAKHEKGECCTGVLISSIESSGVPPADGYYLTVEIIGSGIQNKPANVFNTEWESSGLKVKTTDQEGNELPPEEWTLMSKEGQE